MPGNESRYNFDLTEKAREMDIAMMTTKAQSGLLVSRPMFICDTEPNTLWFFTSMGSGVVEDINHHEQVNLSFLDRSKKEFLSVIGQADLIKSGTILRDKIDKCWDERFEQWFESGRSDSDLALIKVNVINYEYWSNSKSVFQVIRDYVADATEKMGEHTPTYRAI